MLKDWKVLDLLIKIDNGHQATDEEKQTLGAVTMLHWGNANITKLPDSMGMLGTLRILYMRSSKVSDLNALSDVTSLEHLDLEDTQVSDLSALSGLTSLEVLDLQGTQVSDISPLSGMTSMRHLNLNGTFVSDVGVLANMRSLSILSLGNTKVHEISALSGLRSLECLDLSGLEIDDPGALSELSNLSLLNLQNAKTTAIPENILNSRMDFKLEYEPKVYLMSDKGVFVCGLTLTDQAIRGVASKTGLKTELEKEITMYQLFMPKNNPVIRHIGQNFIIDTGAPFSFNYLGLRVLEIDGRRFKFNNAAVVRKTMLDEMTGSDIAGIIGLDILRETGLTIDLEKKTVEFSSEIDGRRLDEWVWLCFDNLMESYIVTNDVFLGERLKNAIIDTGAPVAYVSARRIGELEKTGLLKKTGEMYEDVSPELGALKGEYLCGDLVLRQGGRARRIQLGADECTRCVKFGTMPALLDMLGVFDAILGITALTDKQIVFDFERNLIGVRV